MAIANSFYKLAGISLCAALAWSSSASADTAVTGLRQGPTILVGPNRGVADPTIYDSATGASFTSTGSTPRTFIGGAANIVGAGPQVDLTSLDIFMVSSTAVSYTNIRARIQLWDTYTAAANPVFSNAAGGVIEVDLGATTTVANTVTTVGITLGTALRLNSLAGKGFAVSFQGDTGSGLAETTDLTSAMSVNGAMAVGTSAAGGGNGFYRNVGGQTTFNFVPSDLRTFTGITDTRASLRLRGQSNVPVTLQSFKVD